MNDVLLKPEEKAVFALRSLYSRYGYLPYKMSKFEEYDLYGKNKDFLISDGIITFTDARGKLLALKPDVTLSIIKNTKDAPDHTEKVYYNENVYRPARDSHVFKEIMQTGLECVGDIGIYHVCEVLTLAIKSLSLLDENYALDLSHIGLVAALLKEAEVDDKQKESLIACLEMKNEGALTAMETAGEVSKKTLDVMHALLGEYRTADEAVAALSPFAKGEEALAAMHEFTEIYRTLAAARLTDKVRKLKKCLPL